jgi:large conductance mechanosensitive channel
MSGTDADISTRPVPPPRSPQRAHHVEIDALRLPLRSRHACRGASANGVRIAAELRPISVALMLRIPLDATGTRHHTGVQMGRRLNATREELVMLQGFKQFLLRGNVLDLAVAVVLGSAFGAVITALVKDLLTPLIGAIGGQPDFSALQFTVNGSRFLVGDFVNAIVAFIMVAAAIYFFVVVPVNAMTARRRSGEAPVDPTTRKCPECLSEVPIAARRCAFCAQSLVEPAPKRMAG